MSMVGEVFDEPLVKVDEPNKGLNLFLVLWYWSFCYTRNLDCIHLHLAFQYNNSEVLYPLLLKLAFLWFEVQLVFPEMLQHSLHNVPMLQQCLSEYEDVI